MATGCCVRTFAARTGGVASVCPTRDARYALSGDLTGALRLWFLDWELQDRQPPADWDEGARAYLEVFLRLQQPKGADLITPIGPPKWSDGDFARLLEDLGYRGYGWLRPEGVRRELERMTREWSV